MPLMDMPGIDEFEAGLFEIPDVAGGQSGLELAADRGDLSIRDADGATDPVTVGGDYCVVAGSNLVERFDAPTEILVEQPVHGRCQGSLAMPSRQSRYPVQQFGRGHCRGQDFRGGYRVQSAQDTLVGVLTGQLRQDIGIEDDHASKTAARGVSLRGGRSRSTPPPAANRS